MSQIQRYGSSSIQRTRSDLAPKPEVTQITPKPAVQPPRQQRPAVTINLGGGGSSGLFEATAGILIMLGAIAIAGMIGLGFMHVGNAIYWQSERAYRQTIPGVWLGDFDNGK